ncbi:MAG: TetR family transcriptional regulator [Clostridium sp.]|uniref:TetR/AcrR family transcriptional regulator n=1 Tax=Clostridium sp. TaxID=1506 RepID=UPI003217D5CA
MNKFSETPREVILQAAKEIAVAESISAISIRSVASKCKISIGTVYNSFETKSDLLVAVVEDFWRDAFVNFDECLQGNKDVFEKIQGLYDNLFRYLNQFQENWLDQLSLLKTSEKSLGRRRENEFFKRIRKSIVALLDSEETISSETWTDTFTKEKLAEFIFTNMLAMLKRGEVDIDFFLEGLKRMIY